MKTIRRDIIQRGTVELMKYLRSRLTDEEIASIRDKLGGNASPDLHPTGGSQSPVPDKFAMKTAQSLDLSKKEIDRLPAEAVDNALEAGVRGVDLSKNFFK
jgi:hypothetical protein